MVYPSSRRFAALPGLFLCAVLEAFAESMATPITPAAMAMESGGAQPIESAWTSMGLKPVGLPHAFGKASLPKGSDRAGLKQEVPSLFIL